MNEDQTQPSDHRQGRSPERRLFVAGIVVIVVGVLIAAGVLLPQLIGTVRGPSPSITDQTNLADIARAVQVFAQYNNGALPPTDNWDATLVWHGLVAKEGLVSPEAKSRTTIVKEFPYDSDAPPLGSVVDPPSYILVPASRLTGSADRVLLYEHPDLATDGGWVAFHGGHVEFLAQPEYGDLIDRLTLEDGTPWAPHKQHPFHGP